ncbi:TIGR01777 family oxidoreductase [Janthinobacterium sp. HLX7-2]|uniref:TIGR01777 family oxidoreductase n=1 Tax=Janthinobacterium sp. HLX7-2 TaxID=1259331 RepID=UPI003F297E1A
MNTHLLALQLMAAQGCLGAFDTIYHHEITEALPQKASARLELSIHATRALIYSLLFVGLAAWEWHGAWAWVLAIVFGVEIVLTLWDFVVEDQTRLLPATERVTHTVLAINAGAFIALLALNSSHWAGLPTALVWQPYGWLSVFLVLCGVGVGLSGLRDAYAVWHLGQLGRRKVQEKAQQAEHLAFAATPQAVLVTGATGFIGQQLVSALLADGHAVTVLTRQPKQAAWTFDGQVRCIKTLGELPDAQRIDMVVNLAGARIVGRRWTQARKAALRRSRVALTQELVAWIARAAHKPRVLLSASAIGYYGVQAQGDATELDEDSAPQPIFMSQLCSEWEAAARQAEKYGVQVACMRFGLVFGHQGSLPQMLLPIRFGLGGPLGSGRQWMSWVHVHDVIGAIAHLARRSEEQLVSGAYNFCAPQAIEQRRFAQVAGAVLHRPAFMPTPAWGMRTLLGEQADLLVEGQRVAPRRLLDDGFVFRYPQLEGALRSL